MIFALVLRLRYARQLARGSGCSASTRIKLMSHLEKAASTSSPSFLRMQAVVHKDAGELTADGLGQQRRRDGGVHAAGQGQQHLPVADLLPASERWRVCQ